MADLELYKILLIMFFILLANVYFIAMIHETDDDKAFLFGCIGVAYAAFVFITLVFFPSIT